jgi:hypothetical protein
MRPQQSESKNILRRLSELDSLSTQDLRARWRTLYSKDPPRFKRQFLIKHLAYRIQEIAYGGLDDNTRERMDELLDDAGYDVLGRKVNEAVRRTRKNTIVPGAVIKREWHGEQHEVIALAGGGFEYRGMPYRSLSAVARAITGTRWSGPLFFGLRGEKAMVTEATNGRS